MYNTYDRDISKNDFLKQEACAGKYQATFFHSFDSFSDAKSNLKAIFVLPISNFECSLISFYYFQMSILLGLVNMVFGVLTFDLDEINRGVRYFFNAVLFLWEGLKWAVSIITDTLEILARLVTHSLATLALGIVKTGEAVSGYVAPLSARAV